MESLNHFGLNDYQSSSSPRLLHIHQWRICQSWISWIRVVVLPSKRRGKLFFAFTVKCWSRVNTYITWSLMAYCCSMCFLNYCTQFNKKASTNSLEHKLAVCRVILGWAQAHKTGCWILGKFVSVDNLAPFHGFDLPTFCWWFIILIVNDDSLSLFFFF